jgi:hypothetical protein
MPTWTPKDPRSRRGPRTTILREDMNLFGRAHENPGPDNITFEDKTYCRRCAKIVSALEKAACSICQD